MNCCSHSSLFISTKVSTVCKLALWLNIVFKQVSSGCKMFLMPFLKRGIGQIASMWLEVQLHFWQYQRKHLNWAFGNAENWGKKGCLLSIPDSKYFSTCQNCEIQSSWNSLLATPSPLLWEVFFTSVRVLICVRELCSCCVSGGLRAMKDVNDEKLLLEKSNNSTFLQASGIYSSLWEKCCLMKLSRQGYVCGKA